MERLSRNRIFNIHTYTRAILCFFWFCPNQHEIIFGTHTTLYIYLCCIRTVHPSGGLGSHIYFHWLTRKFNHLPFLVQLFVAQTTTSQAKKVTFIGFLLLTDGTEGMESSPAETSLISFVVGNYWVDGVATSTWGPQIFPLDLINEPGKPVIYSSTFRNFSSGNCTT